MKKISKIRIGYDVNGTRHLKFASPNGDNYKEWDNRQKIFIDIPVTYKDNIPFKDFLVFQSYSRSRSGFWVIFRGKNDEYYMTMQEFFRIFKNSPERFNRNCLEGTFAFVRKGGVLSLVLVD